MTREPGKPRSETKPRPFPWMCGECGKKEVRAAKVRYQAHVRHDGRLYEFTVPKLSVGRCAACQALVFDNKTDEQISRGLRDHLRLLQPEQMEEHRKELGLSQRELAERIGVAAETICRWEGGMLIQSRAMDNLLRVYFTHAQVRKSLHGRMQRLRIGRAVPAIKEPRGAF